MSSLDEKVAQHYRDRARQAEAERDELRAKIERVEAWADEREKDAYACARPSECPACLRWQSAVIGVRRALRGES